ncbi:MAG: hypothetical protein WCX74_00270 [Candidatus Paceibacterota bacterium]
MNKKEKAVALRKSGLSYSEILKEIPVAKSTLSLWLRDVGLAKQQRQKITEKRIKGALRGANARKEQRIKTTKEIKDIARTEIGEIVKRDLWLMGIALYWAEGAKEKDYGTKALVSFSNSDSKMILLFRKWLKDTFLVSDNDLIYELYIHETADIEKSKRYWINILSIQNEEIRVYLKKNKVRTIRKNIENDYYGLVRIKVSKSTNLNRKIAGWVEGVCDRVL